MPRSREARHCVIAVSADLLAAKAELERQQEEEKVKIGDLVHDPLTLRAGMGAQIKQD